MLQQAETQLLMYRLRRLFVCRPRGRKQQRRRPGWRRLLEDRQKMLGERRRSALTSFITCGQYAIISVPAQAAEPVRQLATA